MNDRNLNESWEERWGNFERRKSKGRIWMGLLLLIGGGLLFLRSIDLLILPSWIFSWPVFLIALGVISGISEKFRGGFWLVALFIGGIFLANEIDPGLNAGRFIAPIIIFSLGLLFIFGHRPRRWRHNLRYNVQPGMEQQTVHSQSPPPPPSSSEPFEFTDRRDYVDITSVFGSIRKNVLTKNFKGGDVTCFMGGAELNLTQADFDGEIRMDLTNVFGGTKLIVPSTWHIHSDMVTIFGGIDDKRQMNGTQQDPNKTLILDGTCLFGGIEIRSY